MGLLGPPVCTDCTYDSRAHGVGSAASALLVCVPTLLRQAHAFLLQWGREDWQNEHGE